MNKNFQDILNEKIGKQERRVKPLSGAPIQEESISYNLLFHLNNSLNIKLYKTNPSYSFNEAKPVTKAEPITPIKPVEKVETYGYFVSFDGKAEAKLFFASHNESISENLSIESLKKSFRKLALKLHPDTTGGDAEAFISLRLHYKALEQAWRPYKEAA